MGLRTDGGLIVSNFAEVLPMAADLFAIGSFLIFLVTKFMTIISQQTGTVKTFMLNEHMAELINH